MGIILTSRWRNHWNKIVDSLLFNIIRIFNRVKFILFKLTFSWIRTSVSFFIILCPTIRRILQSSTVSDSNRYTIMYTWYTSTSQEVALSNWAKCRTRDMQIRTAFEFLLWFPTVRRKCHYVRFTRFFRI